VDPGDVWCGSWGSRLLHVSSGAGRDCRIY
jgi:hypothetical protein